ncbi:hypothetical protein B1H18_09950 [Streptomyces tsukubensis]|uniref:ESAT-6-like protein n=1 Tax=Streptomyces tsukubensis TaxID=83656 RepID=A0A1V4ACH3_9ACTN|nr:hypothetical protein B1H18_09950 [Streptomyces tsukubensis]
MPNFEDGNIFVDFTSTDYAIDDMQMQTNQIKSWLDALAQELDHLDASWVGDDAVVYKEKQTAWNSAADQMGALLASHASTLGDVTHAFDENQKRSAQGWSSLKIGR